MVLKPIDAILFVLFLCVVDYVCGENLVEAEKNLNGYPEVNSENGCISKTDISCGVIKDIDEEGHQVVNLTGGLDDDIRGLKDYVKESQTQDVASAPGQIVTLFFRGFFQFLLNVIRDIYSGTPAGGAAGGNNNQGGTNGGGGSMPGAGGK